MEKLITGTRKLERQHAISNEEKKKIGMEKY